MIDVTDWRPNRFRLAASVYDRMTAAVKHAKDSVTHYGQQWLAQ